MFSDNELINFEEGNGSLRFRDQIPDGDAFFSGGRNPLAFGIEGELADLGFALEFSGEFVHFGDVPDSNDFSSSCGGEVFAVGGDADTVDVFVMMFERASDLEIGVPNFDSSIPAD